MLVLFLCAGSGTRMEPITPKTHKSMIPINGTPMMLQNLKLLSEIPEITHFYVVASSEQIQIFEDKITSVEVHYIENNESSTYNNWFSVLKALNTVGYSEDILVVEGDILLKPEIVPLIRSNLGLPQCPVCFCRYREGHEWSLVEYQGKWNIVKDSSGMCMSGLSIVPKEKCKDLHVELNKLAPEDFWDDAFLKVSRLDLHVVDVGNSIQEFDSIADLSKVLSPQDIATLISEDGSAEPTSSMTNYSFIINFESEKSVVRIPGVGTNQFINRDREKASTGLACYKGLSPRTKFYDSGVKISKYLEDKRISDVRDIPLVLKSLRSFHSILREDIGMSSTPCMMIDLIKEIRDYEECYIPEKTPEDYSELLDYYLPLISKYQHTDVVLCHRDLDPRNLLVDNSSNEVKFIDLEYSGILNRYWDLAAHVSELRLFYNYNWEKDDSYPKAFLTFYGEPLKRENLLMWEGIVDFVWSCWTIAKESLGEDYGTYLQERWESACRIKNMISR